MPEQRLACPRCHGRMEPGFIMDRGDYSIPDVAKWVEGAPQKSFWRGLDMRDREVLPLASYRCEQCGYVEFYARRASPG